jgi:hypothetical protein
MKLRFSNLKNNGKLRWNLRRVIHYLRTKLYTDYLQKKVTTSLWASFMALRVPVISIDFSSFLIFAINTSSILYIFWTIIVAVDFSFTQKFSIGRICETNLSSSSQKLISSQINRYTSCLLESFKTITTYNVPSISFSSKF